MAYKLYHKDADYSYVLGPFPSFECLKWRSDLVRDIFYADNFNEQAKLLGMAKALGLKAELAPKLLEKLARGQKEPYVGVIYDKENFYRALSPESPHLVLHEIRNSGNLGTILRACLAFGIHDIALIGETVSIFLPEIARASMGAIFALNIAYFPDLASYISAYGKDSRQLYTFCLSKRALSLQAALTKPLKNQHFSLIFGNEGQGLPSVCEQAPFQPIMIEQSKDVDSLNLAIACSLAMYEFQRKVLSD